MIISHSNANLKFYLFMTRFWRLSANVSELLHLLQLLFTGCIMPL